MPAIVLVVVVCCKSNVHSIDPSGRLISQLKTWRIYSQLFTCWGLQGRWCSVQTDGVSGGTSRRRRGRLWCKRGRGRPGSKVRYLWHKLGEDKRWSYLHTCNPLSASLWTLQAPAQSYLLGVLCLTSHLDVPLQVHVTIISLSSPVKSGVTFKTSLPAWNDNKVERRSRDVSQAQGALGHQKYPEPWLVITRLVTPV